MNYHIITQDKFFDAYIEDIYKLHQEANNIFWVRGEKGDLPWLNTNRSVDYLGDDDPVYYINKLETLQPQDKLFVSWYDSFIGQAIIDSGIPNDVYVFMMGGEFYADPFWYHANWLFDKCTLKYLKNSKCYGYPHINWKRKPHNWWKIYKDFQAKRVFFDEQQELYKQKLKTIQRINYLVLPKEDRAEYERVNELYPESIFKMANGVFDQNYDLAIQKESPIKGDLKTKILVGNSADPTNNYLDAYKYLQKKVDNNCEIYSSLSYGDELNRQYIITEGKKIFGRQYHPITEYMDRQKYIDHLNNMDVVIMYHNRQQACGNIMTAIALGKPVFMKSINPIFGMLKELGISSVHDVRTFEYKQLFKIIAQAHIDRPSNASKIGKAFSEQIRLEYWRELLK